MVRDSYTSGAGEEEVYKPIWFAYDALDAFLNDGLTPRATINTTSRTGESSTTEVNTEEIADVVNEGKLKKREVPPPDDCEIYAMGLAKKLRSFTEEEKLEIMYEFDGIILHRRRAKNPNQFTNCTFSPSTPFSRPTSAVI
ncbi:hypothetical protein PYW08_006273 [Mythimna loreyi]|uniref:Uncharacterized protein n=1 Tax=Mythimna loreyi TaxID=667449 RepID=A0ACC2QM69_9NEOP|nr:hypothetical protein PYW08_006273 [Mythimna loreyi]